MDIEFLNTCHKFNVIPNFLRFRVTNKTLKGSLSYSRCQQLLLNEEIRCKKRRFRRLMFEYDRIKQELQYQLLPIDFMHVSSLFLVSNDKAIRKNDKIHGRKLQKLIPNIHEKSIIDNVSYDPNKVICNFSNYHLTDSDTDKSLLIKGLNSAIPPKKIEYSKFLLPFELLFRDIKSNSESSVDLASVKARLQDTSFTSYSAFNKDNSPPSNLSNNEFESLCKLKNKDNLVIQKADKGNTIVILDKDSYLKSVETLLKDSCKFKNIPIAPNKDLNHVINSEKRVIDLLKKPKNKNVISEETYNKLRPVGSKPRILYGSVKVHKPLVNGLPPFTPILSAIGTPTYKLAKFLVPVLSDITQNEFTVKDSFTFVDEISTQNSHLYMTSLDFDALFTNIPLDETTDICLKKLFKTSDTLVKGISKNDFRDFLNFATKKSFFTFNSKFYIQVDGVAMTSPLGPILADIFLSHHEENWLNKCPIKFKRSFFIEDMLMIILCFSNHLNLLTRFANICPLNIRT